MWIRIGLVLGLALKTIYGADQNFSVCEQTIESLNFKMWQKAQEKHQLRLIEELKRERDMLQRLLDARRDHESRVMK